MLTWLSRAGGLCEGSVTNAVLGLKELITLIFLNYHCIVLIGAFISIFSKSTQSAAGLNTLKPAAKHEPTRDPICENGSQLILSNRFCLFVGNGIFVIVIVVVVVVGTHIKARCEN